MARGNYFKPSYTGYRSVLNGPDAKLACESKAVALAASAARQSGIDYAIDSMQGLNRIHTRVSTTSKADFFKERRYHALSIALGSMLGNPAGVGTYKTLGSRVKAVHRTKSKGWKAGRYRKAR